MSGIIVLRDEVFFFSPIRAADFWLWLFQNKTLKLIFLSLRDQNTPSHTILLLFSPGATILFAPATHKHRHWGLNELYSVMKKKRNFTITAARWAEAPVGFVARRAKRKQQDWTGGAPPILAGVVTSGPPDVRTYFWNSQDKGLNAHNRNVYRSHCCDLEVAKVLILNSEDR